MSKSFWVKKVNQNLLKEIARKKSLLIKPEKVCNGYEPSGDDDVGYDDSEQFRWEEEHKKRCAERGIYYAPTYFSECYETEIMGRPSGYVLD